MTPEKLQLLREWIQSEIQQQIVENSDYDSAFPYKKKTDALFLKVCQLFCGVD